jgi:hypothetical protein
MGSELLVVSGSRIRDASIMDVLWKSSIAWQEVNFLLVEVEVLRYCCGLMRGNPSGVTAGRSNAPERSFAALL